MTISVVGVGTYAVGTGNLTPTLHASTAEGDLLVAFANKRSSSDKLVAPAGWSVLYQHTETAINGNASEMTFYGKIAGASESSPTFTATGSSVGLVQVLTASSTLSFNISTVASVTSQVSSNPETAIPAAAITPTLDNCLVLFGGKYRDTGATTAAGALSGTTELGEQVAGTTASLLTVWSYVIQTTAGALNPGSWSISGATTSPATTAAISVALIEESAIDLTVTTQPLYYGAVLLANKTNLKFKVSAGISDLNGESLASGVNGTTNGSGVFTLPTTITGTAEVGAGDPVFLNLYWEEGSTPVVDRSLIVKTTLVAV